MSVALTAFYAALLTFLYLVLCRNVIAYRRKNRIALGAEADPALLRRVRVQSNFAEYVPLALVLIAFAETQGLAPVLIHALGLALLSGRCLHAIGVSREPEDFRFRVSGMALTFGALCLAAVANLILSLFG